MANKKYDFESAINELEATLEKMSDPAISLDESIELYAKAAKLIVDSNSHLKNAKVRIDEIDKSFSKMEETT